MQATQTKKRLFLDDFRTPSQCGYMVYRVGMDRATEYLLDWDVVKSYDQFIAWINKNGLPDLISFDHDLMDVHYGTSALQIDAMDYSSLEKTGYHCAKFLIDYCISKRLPLPEYLVHSMNTVGTENIISVLESFKKSQKTLDTH